ncbi:hypothetical protein ACCQ08_25045 [Comamonas sp. SY3]|uniref:hypothetical protein n=1 Tax=Comamonas sp. SY3 TaxID=3243601 RepID=UPI003593F487
MEAKHTPGPWAWADVPGAGIQIRGPYKGETRLLFQDIWRKFPEAKWDAEMQKNAQLAASAPELLEVLKEASLWVDGDLKAKVQSTIAKATS